MPSVFRGFSGNFLYNCVKSGRLHCVGRVLDAGGAAWHKATRHAFPFPGFRSGVGVGVRGGRWGGRCGAECVRMSSVPGVGLRMRFVLASVSVMVVALVAGAWLLASRFGDSSSGAVDSSSGAVVSPSVRSSSSAVLPSSSGEARLAGDPSASASSEAAAFEVVAGQSLTAQQRRVFEAIRTQKNPERLSSMIQPGAFDARRWETDAIYAGKWLETIEPGRVYQPAQPSATVPVIERIGDEFRRVPDGAMVTLEVQVMPGAPVTFNSFDSGMFDGSRLATVSVRANDEGVASAGFRQSPGTVGLCRILVASPLASGQVHFNVRFESPQASSGRDQAQPGNNK